MNKKLSQYVDKVNALAVRERLLAFFSFMVVVVFIWWQYYAQPLIDRTHLINEQNVALDQEVQALQISVDTIDRRISEGVHKTRQTQLVTLRHELNRIDDLLKLKTLELIEPEEMFTLMQQMLFAESKLILTELKRKHVTPAFSLKENEADQPQIYRHVMQIRFEGSYEKILRYLNRLEKLDWKLMWDRITLQAGDYPVIKADIEISTLSDSKHWVGL